MQSFNNLSNLSKFIRGSFHVHQVLIILNNFVIITVYAQCSRINIYTCHYFFFYKQSRNISIHLFFICMRLNNYVFFYHILISVSYSKYILFLLPIIELILFIEIGSLIGSFSVILSIFITIFLGYYLIKRKLRGIGLILFNIGNIQNIYEQYTNNFYSILAGILLIVPGYLTDVAGLVILLPFFRPKLSRIFNQRYGKKSSQDNVIEGDYRDND